MLASCAAPALVKSAHVGGEVQLVVLLAMLFVDLGSREDRKGDAFLAKAIFGREGEDGQLTTALLVHTALHAECNAGLPITRGARVWVRNGRTLESARVCAIPRLCECGYLKVVTAELEGDPHVVRLFLGGWSPKMRMVASLGALDRFADEPVRESFVQVARLQPL